MKEKTKSPLRDDPLRLPGQSLHEELQVLRDKLIERSLVLGLIFILTLLEWCRWYFELRYDPATYTLICAVAFAVLIPGLVRNFRKVRQLHLGLDGERAVGQTLERLRSDGYYIYHDLIGPSWNIDHVAIGPGGIFTINTKTHRKPERGKAVINYTSKGLSKNGIDISANLDQAKAEASSLVRILGDGTGKKFTVQPVVAFPGWFIESDGTQPQDVWVLEPKALLKWMRNRENRLTKDQVHSAKRVVSTHIRKSYRAGEVA